ncbi:MAG TPA: trypsin-like peptidase domain-containing protein [Aromatoleum sp.]|uniref:trypsin-like peptidase domain-containing protein n=1 Tax=Aromatoleum sp. TaxID=2307007 RepID=UPI002B4687C1|nr:trypsin-like peptidase domain-containing protein [Aromatoleum sp.]HJV24668.1 trypsin-like peptidase domain-containing protein [Aromatoleum sp.]
MHAPPISGPAAGFLARILFLACLLTAIVACSPTDEAPNFGALMRAQGPAVVNIISLRSVAIPDEGLLSEGQGDDEDMPRQSRSPSIDELGSGIIIHPDGLILTNAHLVAEATSITVRLADGKREFPARLLGADSESDIAVLHIDAHDLPVAKLGNSKSLAPGEWVAAIGSPFGFTNTITAGIVGATGRTLSDSARTPFIQSDVAVNPGSSGGPLINRHGEVVGINSMIFSPTGGYLGLSFAIPIELALDVAHRLERDGQVRRGRLGITVQPLSPSLARAFGVRGDGSIVSKVDPDGPAASAGLRAGDVIVGYSGKVDGAEQLMERVAASEPGTQQTVTLWREGELQRLEVTVGESRSRVRFPSLAGQPVVTAANDEPELVLSDLPPELCRHLGIEFGLRVDRAPPADGGDSIRYGDIIVMVGHQAFADRREFQRLLVASAGGYAPVLVRRGMSAVYVAVKVPERSREAG